MYELSVELSFSAAHCLVGHPGRCASLHGHNYRVVVVVGGERVNEQGMLIDFGDLKEMCARVVDPLDHIMLNESDAFAGRNPTAEALAEHIYEQVAPRLSEAERDRVQLMQVTVYESERSYATYRR
ncbi:MAG: 6-carboxytetrahydropterin synthase QueD [Armatimonadetes bacterium]|nr:6-carboxytetrahydropterin synthase QueD [Armatimonadota bacterium]